MCLAKPHIGVVLLILAHSLGPAYPCALHAGSSHPIDAYLCNCILTCTTLHWPVQLFALMPNFYLNVFTSIVAHGQDSCVPLFWHRYTILMAFSSEGFKYISAFVKQSIRDLVLACTFAASGSMVFCNVASQSSAVGSAGLRIIGSQDRTWLV